MNRVSRITTALLVAGGLAFGTIVPSPPSAGAGRASDAACVSGAGAERCYPSIAEAVAGAVAGETITIRAGLWKAGVVIAADDLTIRGEDGAAVHEATAEGKAAFVVRGRNVVIENIECFDIRVPHENGACVRQEGRDLTLRRVHFRDSEQGILAGGSGSVVIEDSLFERLGRKGQAHAIYISKGDELVVRRSRILASKDEGHEVKSRAARTVIEDSVVASLDGDDSRLLDIPNGGALVVRNTVLQEGGRSVNADVIGFGLERGLGFGPDHAANSVTIEGSTIYLDRKPNALFLNAMADATIALKDNTFVGGRPRRILHNTWFPSRDAAGLPPDPALDLVRP